jgi:hypothetical protein
MASNYWVHLGCVTGPKILEMLEVEVEVEDVQFF